MCSLQTKAALNDNEQNNVIFRSELTLLPVFFLFQPFPFPLVIPQHGASNIAFCWEMEPGARCHCRVWQRCILPHASKSVAVAIVTERHSPPNALQTRVNLLKLSVNSTHYLLL